MESNRTTLERALSMPVEGVSRLPAGQLMLLLEDVAELKARAQRASDHLHVALELRYGKALSEARKDSGTDTGTVRVNDGTFVVISDLPKAVHWDQDGLWQVEKTLAGMGEPAGEYITNKRQVAEKKFTSWPSSLQKHFLPHRIVSAGKPTYRIEQKGEI